MVSISYNAFYLKKHSLGRLFDIHVALAASSMWLGVPILPALEMDPWITQTPQGAKGGRLCVGPVANLAWYTPRRGAQSWGGLGRMGSRCWTIPNRTKISINLGRRSLVDGGGIVATEIGQILLEPTGTGKRVKGLYSIARRLSMNRSVQYLCYW